MVDEQPCNEEWITERRPTAFDADYNADVWATFENGKVYRTFYKSVKQGQPWQICHVPSPYVKPQRYTVGWNSNLHVWNMYENGRPIGVLPRGLPYEAAELAQQIAKFYNEVNQ